MFFNLRSYFYIIILFSINLLTLPKILFIFFLLIFGALRSNNKLKFDTNAFLIFSFVSVYVAFLYLSVDLNDISLVLSFYFLFFSYLIGLNLKLDKEKIKSMMMLTMVSVSIVPIFSIFLELFLNGFEGGGRSINYFYKREFPISATVMAGFLFIPVVISSLIFYKFKLSYFVYYLIVLLCAIRLGSRTLLVLIAILTIYGFLKGRKINVINLIFPSIFIGIFSYFIMYYWDNFIFYFSDRIDSDEAGFLTGGGRLEKWQESLSMIFSHPLGWDLSIFGYSHNLFFDVARVGGIPTLLILLILFFYFHVRILIELSKIKDEFLNLFIFSCVLVFCLVSFSEPLMDGFIYYVSAYFFIIGLFRNYILNDLYKV